MRIASIHFYGVLLAVALLVAGCKDNGGGSEPEPKPDVRVNLMANDGDDTALDGLTISRGGDTLATDVSSYTATAKICSCFNSDGVYIVTFVMRT